MRHVVETALVAATITHVIMWFHLNQVLLNPCILENNLQQIVFVWLLGWVCKSDAQSANNTFHYF